MSELTSKELDFDADLAHVQKIRATIQDMRKHQLRGMVPQEEALFLLDFIDNLWREYTTVGCRALELEDELHKAASAHEPACEYEQDGYRIETACGDVFHLDACEDPPDHCGRCGKVPTIKQATQPPGTLPARLAECKQWLRERHADAISDGFTESMYSITHAMIEHLQRSAPPPRDALDRDELSIAIAHVLPLARKHLDYGPDCHVCRGIAVLERYSTATKEGDAHAPR